MERIVLASTSPRRRELLSQMGIPFSVAEPPVDESAHSHADPKELTRALAEAKLHAVRAESEAAAQWTLAADTLVYDDDGWLGKPANAEEARDYLRRLSGKRHTVSTAVSLLTGAGNVDTRLDTTTVRFATLREEELDWYLATNEWEGVAGGYRIQGRAACFVEELHGSYSAVMGLPIRTVYSMLFHNNYPFTQ